ncbi:MAG TPA: hypothetical protein VGK78_13630 [Nocardioides sp.]|uniref:hypothetical protein n=1 Tax=Nocardioides sp. TaxID=35761 RepID=UPI002F404C38
MPESFASPEELDAELERLAGIGGTPAGFEAAVTQLASRLERPLTHRAILRIARVGWTSYNGLEDVPADEPPEFLGRPWADLPQVPRRGDSEGTRREQLPDEPVHQYIGYLGEDLFAHLGLGEDEAATPFGRAAVGYVSVLALPEFRDMVGWERSVDAHALGMLAGERALKHLGEVGMTAEQEEGCFRWLHFATYAEVAPEHLEEVAARRAIRLAHERRPAGAVAVMTCEVPGAGALRFQEMMSAMPTTAMSADQLRTMLDDLAVRAEDSRSWAIRRDAFARIGRLDLTPSAAVPDYDAVVHGHLMRWLVEEEVPFRPHLLSWTSGYAISIARNLVERPARDGKEVSPVTAHLRAMRLLRTDGSVPLADELVFLAWLMDQRSFGVRLGAYLAARDKQLASEGA